MKARFLLFLLFAVLLQVNTSSYAKEMKSARRILLRAAKAPAQHRSIIIPPTAFIEGAQITVDLLSTIPSVTVIVKDAEGNIVYSSTQLDVDKINIDLTGEEKGEYTLEMQLPTEDFTGEFTVEE